MSSIEGFIFRLLSEFGAGLTVVAVVLIIVWRIFPKIADVWIDKIRAETALIQATQNAVTTTIPQAIGDLKATFISEHKTTVDELKGAITDETSKRIDEKLATIERRVLRSTPDSDTPPATARGPLPSQPAG